MSTSPTVVLVYGAFADASGYGGVIRRLQAEGIAVRHFEDTQDGLLGRMFGDTMLATILMLHHLTVRRTRRSYRQPIGYVKHEGFVAHAGRQELEAQP